MDSIWLSGGELTQFGPLEGSKDTDVLIIGGGMAGILCAHMLSKAGVDCVLVEADRICNGITKDTTAKITIGHGLLYHKLIRRYGQEAAQLYLDAQTGACEEYANLCQEIPCEYENKDSYVYSMDNEQKIRGEVEALNHLGEKAEFVEDIQLPFRVAGAVRVRNQAQFHPLKFVGAVAKGLPIYEKTKVLEIMPGAAVTQYGTIRCKKIIVATHFPMVNKHGSYFLKMYQHRSYVVALEGASLVDGMYVDESDRGLSFRSYQNLLLLGGGGHRTGKNGGNWQELEAFSREHYKDARVIAKWATQDCMTLDGVPYIGQYSANTPGLYVATGFNKWGMSSSMVAAMVLADLVRGKGNKYAQVFSPSRSILHPQLAINAIESVAGLLMPTVPRCPHLGCALRYNKAEHSWDCPCHGSRFDESGEVIDNPATDDKKNMGNR